MLYNIPGPPTSSRAIRALNLPRFYWITIQVVGPGSVRVGPTQAECENGNGSGAFDGVEVVAGQVPPFQTWWKGDLWILAEGATATVRVIIPGFIGGNVT